MSLIDKFFQMKASPIKKQDSKTYTEKDNMGTRLDNPMLATTFWDARQSSSKKDPFLFYAFDNETAAREALSDLPYIHDAQDSGKLICSETLTFGYYQTQPGVYEVIICGEELEYALWEQARGIFAKHGGYKKEELQPEKRAPLSQKHKVAQPEKVKFIREESNVQMGQKMIYRIYEGPDEASAKAFLKQNPVDKHFYYIVIETPVGNFCCDLAGIYKE